MDIENDKMTEREGAGLATSASPDASARRIRDMPIILKWTAWAILLSS